MNFEEYRVASKRTINNMLSDDELKLHGFCGLMSEIEEIGMALHEVYSCRYLNDVIENKKHMASECGDALWFLAELATVLGLTVEDVHHKSPAYKTEEYVEILRKNAVNLGTMFQKELQGKKLSAWAVHTSIRNMLTCIGILAEFAGSSLEDAYQQNVDKLKKRFPDGFSEEADANRAEGDI